MDAPSWNGEDDREFGPDPDEERCPDCGAGPLVVCEAGCACGYCWLALALASNYRTDWSDVE